MIRKAELSFIAARHTTTFRLASAFAVLFLVGLSTALGLVYLETARELTARSDRILQLEARRLLAVPVAELPVRIAAEAASPGRGIDFATLYGGSGERIAGDLAIPEGLTLGQPREVVGADHRPIRVLALRTRFGETIVIGRDVGQIRDLRRTILDILLGSGVATAAAGLLIGLALSVPLLARVRDFQSASERIMRGDFDVRMPISGRRDELDRFAVTVNIMIDEVVRALSQARSVTDAIAHDLRTPLTHVRTLLTRVQQSALLDPAFRAVAVQAVTELEVVLERLAALLRIAELESGNRGLHFAPTPLVPLLASAIELYRPLAEERDQTLALVTTTTATVEANAALLLEAVANLLDNAIKFTPPGGRIDLDLRATAAGPVIEVRDNGPGIDPAEREAVTRRFYRGASSASIAGSGLGLSLVAAIAQVHRFALSLHDGAPGVIVRLCCVDGAVATQK